MKFLQDYMEKKQTEVFDKYGVFFAFSKTQFNDGRKKILDAGILQEGEKLTNFGHGMIGPSKHSDEVIEQLDKIYTESINQDIEENGISNIIQRELDNHEYVITGDIEDTVEKLADYPDIDEDRVRQELPNWREIRKARDLD
jgi:hypothetical protein